MDKFNFVKKTVEDYKCILLTTFEEFELRRKELMNNSYLHVRIEFIGVCGHNSSAVFTNLKSRGTGTRCKDCVKNIHPKLLKIMINC
jgi:hypothetical protein